nr:MAG TPA: hypothetical protein [Caudoviricetes sp.]
MIFITKVNNCRALLHALLVANLHDRYLLEII